MIAVFKGKTIKDNKWIEGYLVGDSVDNPKKLHILDGTNSPNAENEVHVDSVGASTEVTMDNSDHVIFEGDVIKLDEYEYKIVFDQSMSSFVARMNTEEGFALFQPVRCMTPGEFKGRAFDLQKEK